MKKITGVFLTLMLTLTAMCAVFASNAEVSTLSTSGSSALYQKARIAKNDLISVHKVAFVKMTEKPAGADAVDISDEEDGGIMAWCESYDGDDTKKVLYIGTTEDTIKAGSSLAYAFYDLQYLDEISGIELLDTSDVTDMKWMFAWCGYNSNVFTLDLGDNFDTSKVTDMNAMFYYCGSMSTDLILDLGGNFDTSKVTNMGLMFANCGFQGEKFELDLGDKFDTSKVTDMGSMFNFCGSSSTEFTTLDVSGFTVGKDTNIDSFATYVSVTTFIFGDGWKDADLPSGDFAYIAENTATTVINAPDNIKEYNWSGDNRTVTFKNGLSPVWVSDTDAGYYMSEDAKLGMIRFLFDVEVDAEITKSGIKYIKADNIIENLNGAEFEGASETGVENTFYGDIDNISEEKAENTYYAVAYVIADGEIYWSAPIFCQPDFNKYVDYNAGGVQ